MHDPKTHVLNFFKSLVPARKSSFPAMLLGAVSFITIAFVIGFGSAWYMLEKGSALTRNQYGPWQNWGQQGAKVADPYTKAYIARSGRLPLGSAHAQYFQARTDSDGNALTSGCSYTVRGAPLAADWWSIGLYDDRGQVVLNRAERHAFNSKNIARLEDGSYIIHISPHARPDNWLPSGRAERLRLLIRLYGTHVSEDTQSSDIISQSLPSIRKAGCP